MQSIEGIVVTPLAVIDTGGGDVLHGMRYSDNGYSGFGEAYFSTVESGAIKGWKRHHRMVLNLIVPVGEVRFVIYDDRTESKSYMQLQEVIISREDNYCRLTVPSMVWVGFQGLDKNTSIILNIASVEHSPEEVDQQELDKIKFSWE